MQRAALTRGRVFSAVGTGTAWVQAPRALPHYSQALRARAKASALRVGVGMGCSLAVFTVWSLPLWNVYACSSRRVGHILEVCT
jgi:hypothetical protein